MRFINHNSGVITGLMAHFAFIGGLFFDDLRRGESGFLASMFTIGSVSLVLPAFIFFYVQPRCFFLLPDTGIRGFKFMNSRWSLKVVSFIISWSYLLGWVCLWLIFLSELPRVIASYSFLFAMVTTLLISDHLFLRNQKSTN